MNLSMEHCNWIFFNTFIFFHDPENWNLNSGILGKLLAVKFDNSTHSSFKFSIINFCCCNENGPKFKIISHNQSSTITCDNCNPELQCHFAILSCSCSSYQLKKIATKSCLQLNLAIHDFLQQLVAFWLLSVCNYLQCSKKAMWNWAI